MVAEAPDKRKAQPAHDNLGSRDPVAQAGLDDGLAVVDRGDHAVLDAGDVGVARRPIDRVDDLASHLATLEFLDDQPLPALGRAQGDLGGEHDDFLGRAGNTGPASAG